MMRSRVLLMLWAMLIPAAILAQVRKKNGLAFIEALFEKNYNAAVAVIDDELKAGITAATFEELSNVTTAEYGYYRRNIEMNEDVSNGVKSVYYYSEFDKSMIDIKIDFNNEDKITSMTITEHRDFRKDNFFNEEEMTVASDTFLIPGTLLLPEQAGNNKYLAILVHDGYGAPDRNGSIRKYRYLKDMAESLYKQGIATFRFDKRSVVDPYFFQDHAFSIYDDAVTDIISIVNFFRNNKRFNGYKIVLAGHGLGGTFLPLIADSLKTKVNGIIMMAANTKPWQDILIEQYRYVYTLTPTPALKTQIDTMESKARFLTSKSFNTSVPREQLLFNFSAKYWHSILTYKQADALKRVRVPVFILHGERDYQVGMDNFNTWQNNFKNQPGITFKSYPRLNHYFMEWVGTEKSVPEEYFFESHIPDYLMKDMARWMKKL